MQIKNNKECENCSSPKKIKQIKKSGSNGNEGGKLPQLFHEWEWACIFLLPLASSSRVNLAGFHLKGKSKPTHKQTQEQNI
jgi:hypothetical protein